MFTITKEFAFSAAHVLHGLPEGHPCGRLHGHNYVVVVVLEREDLDLVGFVRDYGDLSSVKDFIDNEWDHRHLNDYFALRVRNPTAEVMAKHLFDQFRGRFRELVEVRVSETPKTWAIYRP